MNLSKFNKAIVAMVMSSLYILNTSLSIDIGISEEVVSNFIIGISPLLVWLIPNAQE
jgi:hypothetical protein|tara:strand:- start:1172 stop:1342 length:171 start_codon:yes stop_codon:yes gene_type:complete